jgi:hypothetical protein
MLREGHARAGESWMKEHESITTQITGFAEV